MHGILKEGREIEGLILTNFGRCFQVREISVHETISDEETREIRQEADLERNRRVETVEIEFDPIKFCKVRGERRAAQGSTV